MSMRHLKVTSGGQISIPAEVRRRWATSRLAFEDRGDHVVLAPAPDDPVSAARGALVGEAPSSSEDLRKATREDEQAAEARPRRAR